MLKTYICGVELETCLMNASGCLNARGGALSFLENSEAGAIVSKSGTFHPQKGNDFPRFGFMPHGSINSIGLFNLGFGAHFNYGTVSEKPFIQSIHPETTDDLFHMLDYINKNSTKKRLIELNLLCPNYEYITKRNDMIRVFEDYLSCIKFHNFDKLALGLKLPAFYNSMNVNTMSDLILENNIKFITCINSIPNGLFVDAEKETTIIRPRNGLGAISGIYCKPMALANIYQFYQKLGSKVDIIGCGGVSSGRDAFEMILCGAKAVQIGSHLLRVGVKCFEEIGNELIEIMNQKKYKTLSDFRGRLKLIPKL